MAIRAKILALGACAMLAGCSPALYVRHTPTDFPEAMAELQSAISSKGYVVSRVQRVDYGLSRRGFLSDKYQVVFFGKPGEINRLGEDWPQLAPFLPMRITILETEQGVEMVAVNPQRLARLYPEAELRPTFERWHRDVVAILDQAAGPR